MSSSKKRILLTGARFPFTLAMARVLSARGHEIHAADSDDLNLCRFSNTIQKTHKVASPRFHADQFVKDMVRTVKAEKVDLLIPTFEEIFPLARAKQQFPDHCKVFCESFDKLHVLHDKWLFTERLLKYRIPTPDTRILKSQDDLKSLRAEHRFALKPCYSRAAQEVFCFDTTQPPPKIEVSESKPWLAQQWLEGGRYCTYSVANQGRVTAHVTYPVTYAIDGHSPIAFESVEHPQILAWVQHFVKLENFTGQISFDFVEPTPGEIYVFECNPRTEIGIHLFRGTDPLDRAFLNPDQPLVIPRYGRRRQLMIGMLMYGWRCPFAAKHPWSRFFEELWQRGDVIYHKKDMKPFLMQPLIFAKAIWTGLRSGMSVPAVFTSDYEWNG